MAIAQFLARYPNPGTRANYGSHLTGLARCAGTDNPAAVTPSIVLHWATQSDLANNTIRQRLAAARQFFTWCVDHGVVETNPTDQLQHLRKSYPRTYGKVQSPNPARWLSDTQAFVALIGACNDGTDRGLRDELFIRLGLAGMRRAEITNLTWNELHLDDDPPTITWTGKGRRPRRIVAGPNLRHVIDRWRDRWTDERQQQPDPSETLSRRLEPGNGYKDHHPVRWQSPGQLQAVYDAIVRRARLAGLGHVTPHDLRRTAAGILHDARGADGGRLFDLLDIQRVLGHASPDTTQKSYLEPLDTALSNRASRVLD